MLSELLEGGPEAFGVGQDFRGVHHKGHTMDFVIEAWPLHIAHSLRPHWLIWAKLRERNEELLFSKKQLMLRVSMLTFASYSGQDISLKPHM